MPPSPRIAIIGAGVAGLACGHTLRAAGHSPVVFEKSRGLGGRMATRQTRDGLFFDHGAQYVTARSPAFSSYLDQAQQAGQAAVWPRVSNGSTRLDRNVGTPGMKDLASVLSQSLEVRLETRIAQLARETPSWTLETEDGPTETFDYVVCATPAPQVLPLLPPNSPLTAQIATVKTEPCWALMLAFDTPIPVSDDWLWFDTGAIATAARNSAKPEHPDKPETWVIHAGPAWSKAHLEHSPAEVESLLLTAFSQVIKQVVPSPAYSTAHRWRYALTTKALGQPFISSEDGALFICGDWCLGARVEAAFQSGQAAGQTLLQAISKRAS